MTVTFVCAGQYTFGRQSTRDPPPSSGSQPHAPSTGTEVVHRKRLLGGGAVGDVPVELDADRRGDAHRAPVTDVDRAADLLARRPGGERARERHRGAVDGLRAAAPGVGDAVGELVGARPRLLVRRERARDRAFGPRERDRVEGAVDDAHPRGLRRVGAGGVGRRGVGEGGGLLDRGRCAADDRRRAARGDRDSGHGERAEDDHRRDQQNPSHTSQFQTCRAGPWVAPRSG